MPKLSEGAIVVTIARLPGTELEESIRYNTQMEKAILAAFPEQVEHVWSRIGTPEVATDPMGIELHRHVRNAEAREPLAARCQGADRRRAGGAR